MYHSFNKIKIFKNQKKIAFLKYLLESHVLSGTIQYAAVTESAALQLVSVAVYLYLFDGHAAGFHQSGFILWWEG